MFLFHCLTKLSLDSFIKIWYNKENRDKILVDDRYCGSLHDKLFCGIRLLSGKLAEFRQKVVKLSASSAQYNKIKKQNERATYSITSSHNYFIGTDFCNKIH